MSIRTCLILWYAGILLASSLLIAAWSYHELNEKRGKTKDPDEGWEEVIGVILWCGIPGVLLGVSGGWWLMRKTLVPVATLTRAAERIRESNLHEQLPRTGNGDELDRLTEVFNAMTVRLDSSFQQMREFTLHASHELKTPLTVMHGELETVLRDKTLTSPHRESLLSQLDEVQRLTKIVDGLTLLTKADAGQIALVREPVRLDELVLDALADAKILARPHRVEVRLEICEKAAILGDRHRLRQLLLNLTDNAVKYNQPNGTATIRLRLLDPFAELAITNTGLGIPPELQPRVFDRFFRGDRSHNNAVDGCGLGLSIARWIVSAHAGSIDLSSKNQLTTVTVRLPIISNGGPSGSIRLTPFGNSCTLSTVLI